jgi:hypothetical protein
LRAARDERHSAHLRAPVHGSSIPASRTPAIRGRPDGVVENYVLDATRGFPNAVP